MVEDIDTAPWEELMKAALDTPNTLFLALWAKQGRAVILGSLRTPDGGVLPVLRAGGEQALPLLAAALNDTAALAARHIIVYTNDPKVAATYRRPIRLEPTAANRMAHYVPAEWCVLRALCAYRSWQLIETTALPKARAYWEELWLQPKNNV